MRGLRAISIALVAAALALGGCECGSMQTTAGDASPKTGPKAEPDAPKAKPKKKPPYALAPVQIVWAEAPPLEAPKREEIATWCEEALLGHPEFSGKGEGGATLKGSARVAGGDAKDGSGQILGSVFLELKLETPQGKYTSSAFIGEALPGKEPLDKELPTFTRKIVDEVAHALSMEVRADAASDADLVKMLESADAAGHRPAIAVVRRRKLRAAAPALVKLLKAEDREIVNLAAGGLGEVGSRSAIPALIDAGSRVEPIDRLPVLYAVGELGGPEAIIYLETVEKNSAHPALRNAAKNALERAREPR